ncbi:hypothetical protein BBB56_23005 [Candidatus Pantoea deserta]|uniref:Uncharacterized protein n=1 Tax=Candidatus Pantoea deserta TaxID=1869313 RepID=A0A3N4NEG7_9GAMM|nr:hypothetical protein [Pantoea deserta]RPD91816.1 hypothetical protein BBB56_23005 [Pantoea deserta]
MFSKFQLKGVADEQLNLYMDWLLEVIASSELETDLSYPKGVNETFGVLKQKMMRQELKRHSRELRRVLDEKKRRLNWWCH